ncbi:MAG: [protein-PII] uridylyltransferase [Acidimicrobiales bacterium]|nr:[protein-PII] uridylyltransferase [Acidimicrobiales bacterium]
MPDALDRDTLFGDPTLTGLQLCRAYSDRMDAWLGALYADADPPAGVSLIAVGGYGRAELCPQSDIDLLLLHEPKVDVDRLAERIWYPIWDEGLKLGHAVRTPKEALALAADDLDTATALLSVRHVAGDADLTAALDENALALWRKRSKRWLDEQAKRVQARHAHAGEVAFLLEPDLKEGRGGLRDVHAIHWAEQAERVMLEGDDAAFGAAYHVVLAARVELHRRTKRPGDRLLLQEQDAVAEALGQPDTDAFMRSLSAAAREIAWRSDEVWNRVESSIRGPRFFRVSRDRELAPGVVLREGQVELHHDADPVADPLLALRAAVGAAENDVRFERGSLHRLAEAGLADPFPWDATARALLARLLLAGPPAIDVIEALDQVGLWVQLLPEWAEVRCKPQRNAYHTFTVDRHLCVAATNAASLVDRVDRPDLLVVGTLLHDIGKGYPGDHIEVGIDVVAAMADRMGYAPDEIAMLQDMVRHHLLLPDVATRRDLSDDGTIEKVAELVGSGVTLRLLDALTEADSLATGPAAWNDWKAELVAELVERTAHVLSGGSVQELIGEGFPSDAQLARMAEGRQLVETADDRLQVISPDRPGMFSRVAGVLSLNGLDVLSCAAHSNDDGMAIEVFRVASSVSSVIPWDRVVPQLDAALAGRLALSARLDERARTYARARRTPGAPKAPSVHIDNELSHTATVVEVRTEDGIGVLYRITRAIAELELDIRSAKVQTVGHEAVDAFYLRDRNGDKIADPAYLTEIEKAILYELLSCT